MARACTRGKLKEGLVRVWLKASTGVVECIDHYPVGAQVGYQQEILSRIKHHLMGMGALLPSLNRTSAASYHHRACHRDRPVSSHRKSRGMSAAIVGCKDIVTLFAAMDMAYIRTFAGLPVDEFQDQTCWIYGKGTYAGMFPILVHGSLVDGKEKVTFRRKIQVGASLCPGKGVKHRKVPIDRVQFAEVNGVGEVPLGGSHIEFNGFRRCFASCTAE